MKIKIPQKIKNIIISIEKKGFEAYVVGGCVRDNLMNKNPIDWDITTNATPDKIQEIFPNNFINNEFGTVTIISNNEEESLKKIEITPYRIEGGYSDCRRPDNIEWAMKIEQDLKRRDFTINALALKIEKNDNISIVDLFDGQVDLQKKIIKAVGNPNERFQEDSLRLLRAVRFAIRLNFKIEKLTEIAIIKNAFLLQKISQERIRDEFLKIINNKNASEGIKMLKNLGLLKYIIPEIEEGFNVSQNHHHIYNVYDHLIYSLKYAAQNNFNTEVRIAALLHDVGKPRTRRKQGNSFSFHNHEVVGANLTKKILERLKFPKKQIEKIVKLVRFHMFYYNVDEVTDSSVRRLIRSVGIENIDDLINLRYCDRIGSGVPKANPYKLRHLKFLIEKISTDAISVDMLKISGNEVVKILNENPGPKIGYILNILLSEVIDNQSKNKNDHLKEISKKLSKLNKEELKKKSIIAKKNINFINEQEESEIKQKYWVK